MAKRLYRSETDQIIAGVCGGIAEYLDVDPVIVRVLFALALISEGFGLMLYIILWIVIPTKGSVNKEHNEALQENAKEIKTNVAKVTKGLKKSVTSDTKKK